eukprot:SAG31_NODE_607_length_13606_cov_11.366699_2_plen_307_part_00
MAMAQNMHQRLAQLLESDPQNRECADCSEKPTTWGSWNLGLFLCARCCEEHRNLGPQISRPRSFDANIDVWTDEHLEAMKEVGNTDGDAYWCYRVPFGRSKPQAGDYQAVLRDWIEAKYVRKEFIKRPVDRPVEEPTVQEYEREGWLWKESGAGKGKWQMRYFELRDFTLDYYKAAPDRTVGKKNVPQGSIAIKPSTQIACAPERPGPQDERRDTVFELRTDDRIYYFASETSADMVHWLVALRGVRTFAGSQEGQQAVVALRTGYLLKKKKGTIGGVGSNWKSRWCDHCTRRKLRHTLAQSQKGC